MRCYPPVPHPKATTGRHHSRATRDFSIRRFCRRRQQKFSPVTESKKAVFLSYASQDADAALRICTALRAAGIEVWFDQSELRGGDAWDQKIRHQLRDCALFVPIISANTVSRPEGYFRLEWALADQRTQMIARNRAFIVPVCVDRTPDAGADVPESFLRVQWTRLPAGETPSSFCRRIAALFGGADEPSRPQTSPGLAPPVARPRNTVRWIAVAGAAVLVAGAIALQPRRLMAPRSSTGSAGTPGAVPEKSIAVLPFADMSEKKDQEYFGDGMAEEILNLLVKIPELKVIGRTSSFRFKGKADDLRTIGATLGAAYVVQGSVRRSGDRVRVTAQLFDTRDGAHRWSETYDRDASDVLKVQDEIAASLVRALQLEATASGHLQAQASLRSGEAHDIYLRGLHALDRRDQHGFEEAAADFRHALELDPKYLPAAEALALALRDLADDGFVPAQSGRRGSAQARLQVGARPRDTWQHVHGIRLGLAGCCPRAQDRQGARAA